MNICQPYDFHQKNSLKVLEILTHTFLTHYTVFIHLQYRSKLRNHVHAVKPRLCRTCLLWIHRGGTKTATAAKTKATESRGELDAVKIQ